MFANSSVFLFLVILLLFRFCELYLLKLILFVFFSRTTLSSYICVSKWLCLWEIVVTFLE